MPSWTSCARPVKYNGPPASVSAPPISRGEQGQRIEMLSKLEHDLIEEVHPQVSDIKEGMEAVIAVVKENVESHPPAAKRKRP